MRTLVYYIDSFNRSWGVFVKIVENIEIRKVGLH